MPCDGGEGSSQQPVRNWLLSVTSSQQPVRNWLLSVTARVSSELGSPPVEPSAERTALANGSSAPPPPWKAFSLGGTWLSHTWIPDPKKQIINERPSAWGHLAKPHLDSWPEAALLLLIYYREIDYQHHLWTPALPPHQLQGPSEFQFPPVMIRT